MLRLLHTADVHLGARHADLGDRAAMQRERQYAAFVAAIDLAIEEKVDLFLIAGDLFDSNVQPRRSVERAVAQIRRLVDARIRIVIAPGTHDVFDRASIYRAYDLPALAGAVGSDLVTVLDPEHPEVHLRALDLMVHGRPFATKRAPYSPLQGLDVTADDKREARTDAGGEGRTEPKGAGAGKKAAKAEGPEGNEISSAGGRSDATAAWHVGLLHAAVAIPGQTDRDDVVITTDEIAASHLDYLALGHWHSTTQGKAGRTLYAYAGAPEPIALDQDRAGNVLLVTLDAPDGKKRVTVEERRVGKTRFERLDLDASEVGSQPRLCELLQARADPDLVLDVQLIGVKPDELDLDVDEVETQLADRFLKVRVRDRAVAPLPEGLLPPPDTVLGAFIRDLEARIAEVEAADDEPSAGELRDALRLGRLLLAGAEVTL